MSFTGKHYASICEKRLIGGKWVYRCPNKSCKKKKTSNEIAAFNDDGRYLYYKDGGGFTSLMMHMNSCIGKDKCLTLLQESANNTRQRKLVDNEFDTVSLNAKVAFDFIELIVDANIPLSSCGKAKYRNIIYRSHNATSQRRYLHTKQVRKIMIELATIVREKIAKELVSINYVNFSATLCAHLLTSTGGIRIFLYHTWRMV